MKHKVFYSWQSDLPNKTNRGLIGDALERAIKKINAEFAQFSLEAEARPDSPQVAVDQATAGLAGSPDIPYSIFDKIKNSTIFVADISIINGHFREQASDKVKFRPTPNPNVLVELGYAANHLGWPSVICVFNTGFSQDDFRSDVPFDLSVRRILTYQLNSKNKPAAVRNSLVSALEEAIRAILQENDRVQRVRISNLRSLLAELLYNFQIITSLKNELDYWLGDFRESQFERLMDNGEILQIPGELRVAINAAYICTSNINGWIAAMRSVTPMGQGGQGAFAMFVLEKSNAATAIQIAQVALSAYILSIEGE